LHDGSLLFEVGYAADREALQEGSVTVETSNLLTELAAGRRPLFSEQTNPGGLVGDGPPTAISNGVSCLVDGSGKSALVTTLAIQMRSDVRARAAIITCVYDNGATYSFNLAGLGGTPVAYTAGPGEDEEDIVTGLAAALLAEANHAALLSGLAVLDGADSTFTIKGKTWDDWTLAAISAGGGGGAEAIAIEVEPSTGAWFLWALPAGLAANAQEPTVPLETWYRPLADGSGFRVPVDIDWQGFVDTFNTGTVASLYVEIDTASMAGPAGEYAGAEVSIRRPRVFIGPASRESAQSGA